MASPFHSNRGRIRGVPTVVDRRAYMDTHAYIQQEGQDSVPNSTVRSIQYSTNPAALENNRAGPDFMGNGILFAHQPSLRGVNGFGYRIPMKLVFLLRVGLHLGCSISWQQTQSVRHASLPACACMHHDQTSTSAA